MLPNIYRSADTQIVAFLAFRRQQGTPRPCIPATNLKAETKRGFLACFTRLLYQIAVARCICPANSSERELRFVCQSKRCSADLGPRLSQTNLTHRACARACAPWYAALSTRA